MSRLNRIFLVPLAGLALVPQLRAETVGSLDASFEAAERGDLVPIERALASTDSPETRALLRARLAAARLDPGAAEDPVVRRIAASGGDAAQRRAALAVVTATAFGNGQYEEAAVAAEALERALTQAGRAREAEEVGRTGALARLLVGQPIQSVEGGVRAGEVPAHYDRVGLPRISVTINGEAQEAVVDTGANLSVLSRDTARRLGIEILDAQTRVGNGVDGTVPVRVGIADRLEIAGTTFRNVSFLIIDDEHLTFPLPGGYDILAIVGFPVLRALERVRFDDAGRFAVLPADEGARQPSNLRASGNDLFVEVRVAGERVPLHLDTGANQTALSARYAEAHPDVGEGLEISESRQASAGGTRLTRVATWRNVPIELAGRRFNLPEVPLTLPSEEPMPRFYGTLGSNALRAFESYTIDFASMRLELGAPVASAASAP